MCLFLFSVFHDYHAFPNILNIPQVAEMNPPRPMDAAGEGSLYDGFYGWQSTWIHPKILKSHIFGVYMLKLFPL